MPPPIAAPQDIPYVGTMTVSVDATDLERRILRVHETIPVHGGSETILLYPQWLPGNHSPTGRVDFVDGLLIEGDGRRVEWKRDPINVFAFHVNVPAGVSALDVDFDFTSPVEASEGRVVMTPDMLNLQWTALSFYPAGYFARQITVAPSVHLPGGWQFGTALEPASRAGPLTTFKPVSFETLIDSPMFAGRYFKRFDLTDPGAAVPVHLDVVADRPELLDAKPEQIEAHRGGSCGRRSSCSGPITTITTTSCSR
jgi:predicted metalloprotease with PDZ domain